MKVRLGLVLATATLITGSGCAAGGGGSAGTAPAGPSLPGGVVLEEGIRPRDNTHTRSADLALTQAQSTTDEAVIQQRFQEALEAALQGIGADPENPKSYFQAGQAYVGLGDYVGADSMLTKAEELHPRYILETEPWREMGWVDAYNDAIVPMNNGDLESAAEIFEEANALYDGRPEALLQLGSIYSQLDRTDEAVAAFRGAMEVLEGTREDQMADSANAPIWIQHWEIATTGLGQTLTYAERYQEAADLYGALLEEDPGNPTFIGALANNLSELGMADSVQVLYDQLLADPTLGERDFFNAGVGLYQIENYEIAAQAFRRAAEMNPFNRDARLNLAQTLSIDEKFEELVPAARDLIEVDPRNALGWIFLTRALSELERTEEANEVFNEYQSIGYEIEDLSMRPNPDGGATFSGSVKNTGLEPGTPITLRFHFGGTLGTEIGTVDVQVQAPEVEQYQVFQGEFVSPEEVTGYKYEAISP
ncbi:MAG: tetratricopeptide repeat protein [Longimicrobiales bacterium]